MIIFKKPKETHRRVVLVPISPTILSASSSICIPSVCARSRRICCISAWEYGNVRIIKSLSRRSRGMPCGEIMSSVPLQDINKLQIQRKKTTDFTTNMHWNISILSCKHYKSNYCCQSFVKWWTSDYEVVTLSWMCQIISGDLEQIGRKWSWSTSGIIPSSGASEENHNIKVLCIKCCSNLQILCFWALSCFHVNHNFGDWILILSSGKNLFSWVQSVELDPISGHCTNMR